TRKLEPAAVHVVDAGGHDDRRRTRRLDAALVVARLQVGGAALQADLLVALLGQRGRVGRGQGGERVGGRGDVGVDGAGERAAAGRRVVAGDAEVPVGGERAAAAGDGRVRVVRVVDDRRVVDRDRAAALRIQGALQGRVEDAGVHGRRGAAGDGPGR